jgi:hypothetical protein
MKGMYMEERLSSDVAMLRHTVATVVYRGAKTVRDAPKGFDAYRVKPGSRAPIEILAHIGDLFEWALSMAKGAEAWHNSIPIEWDREVNRFFRTVTAFDDFLDNSSGLACSAERLFQGPVADALTHIGQLAMLRRMYGSPIRGENFFRAEIAAGRVGPEQATPKKEFD